MIDISTARSPRTGRKRQIGFRCVEIDRQQKSRIQMVKEVVPAITLRRKTHLVAFIAFLCQFAQVDPFNSLPIGILLYCVGLKIAIDLIQMPADEIEQYWDTSIWESEEQQELQRRKDDLQRHFEQAKFEFQVLKGQRNAKIVTRVEEDGSTTIYAI